MADLSLINEYLTNEYLINQVMADLSTLSGVEVTSAPCEHIH